MDPMPTVRIKHPTLPNEFIVINESDFNPAIHERYEEPKSQPQEKRRSKKSEPGQEQEEQTQEPEQ